MKLTIAGAALLLLAACGGGGDNGGLSDAENDALNNAAEMLDSTPDGLEPGDETGLDNALALPDEANQAAPEEPVANQP